MDLNTLISKQTILADNPLDNPVHISFCADENYVFPAGILLTSILQNNPHLQIAVHLFVLSIHEDDIEKFKQFKRYQNVNIILYYVNENFVINPNTLVISHVSIASCLRLFIAEYLHEVTDRLLYLDCDMLCNGDLTQIIKHDISQHVAGVVVDVDSMQKKQCLECNLKEGTYFNSGMLYINTQRWHELNMTQSAMQKINDGNLYKYGDQDVLNLLLSEQVVYLPRSYNHLISKKQIEKAIKNGTINQSVILHYAGTKKPWFIIFMDAIYKKHFDSSFWRAMPLKLFDKKSTANLKRYCFYLYKKGQYLSAIKYSFLFLLNKIGVRSSF